MTTVCKPDLRERVLSRGFLHPTDEELIMLIIGSGTKEDCVERLASKIIKEVDVSSPDELVDRLLRIKGVGVSRALSVAAAIEFGRRRTSHLEVKVRTPNDIIPYVQNYAIKAQEHFITVCLSGAHEILNIQVNSIGTLNHAVIHPREIFSDAIKHRAAAIIVCHNHPSGNCTPSEEDIKTTRQLSKASEILGITLLDHIIINKNSYFSFLENQMLNTDGGHQADCI